MQKFSGHFSDECSHDPFQSRGLFNVSSEGLMGVLLYPFYAFR